MDPTQSEELQYMLDSHCPVSEPWLELIKELLLVLQPIPELLNHLEVCLNPECFIPTLYQPDWVQLWSWLNEKIRS